MPLMKASGTPDLRIAAFYCDLPSDISRRIESASPQFIRHIQPVKPLNPAMLHGPQALSEEVALAWAYGVDTFCFWLSAEGELPATLRAILADPSVPIGISLFFDGPLPAVREDVLAALADPRALRVDGQPLLGAGAGGPVEEWQAAAADRIGTSLFLVEPYGRLSRLSAGFSAAVQIPPRGLPPLTTQRRIEPVSPAFAGQVDEFTYAADAAMRWARAAKVPLFPGVCAGFDSTPSAGLEARIMVSPDLGDEYARWLAEMAAFVDDRPVAGTKLVFVNAWNDWLNGARLVPDNRYGYALLRATASMRAPYMLPAGEAEARPAPTPAPAPVRRGSVACVVHGYYADLIPGLIAGLDPAHLFVTSPPEKADGVREVLERLAPAARLRVIENRGRDVRPFLTLLPELEAEGYELVLKVHTKRSPHQGANGSDWLEQISSPLLDLARSGELSRVFAAHPDMGLLGAAGHVLDGELYAGSAANRAWMRRLAREFDVKASLDSPYVAGTMFAARLAIFGPLRGAPEVIDLFEPDMGLKDGTLAHAFERFFGVLTAEAGHTIGEAGRPEGVVPSAQVVKGGYFFARSSTEDELARLQLLAGAR